MDQPGWKGSILRFWQRSYAADYLGYVLLQVAYFGSKLLIVPFKRYFTLSEPAIAYPFAVVERVSGVQNIIYAGLCPLVFFMIYSLVVRPGFHKSHVTILGFIISITLTSLVTDIIKNSVGRPRPDLIDRCKPAPGTSPTGILTIDVCTASHGPVLQDGWRSFPSGHSSFSFSGLGYLTLWLGGQLHVLRPRTDLARVLVALAPSMGALLVALSRMADYRHDVYDVTCGSLLGILVAWFSYRRYFRRLRDPKCDLPYPSRADVASRQGLLVGGKRDLEEQRIRSAEEFELDDLASSEDEARPLTAERESSESGKGKATKPDG
ncbi:hypothetical protein LTR24_001037 [Lithohypha guttulata]|uniref:Phosphatidic acid phosphatase type 2/haloperoxidase domain-containing protein n=1 Tax=Lithohypha guttulata TaxID=1690604 RepID=A0ABR0KP24_9EURO|nr:hypothetical protein LTR24_001037 [Lithohypha guttulata]